jgi:hypothetical protein
MIRGVGWCRGGTRSGFKLDDAGLGRICKKIQRPAAMPDARDFLVEFAEHPHRDQSQPSACTTSIAPESAGSA